jgi:hypothetical protein
MRGGAVRSDLITKLPDMPECQVLLTPHLGALGVPISAAIHPVFACSRFQKGCDG